MLSDQMINSNLENKNLKDIDEISTINNLDDEIPDFKDSKEFLNENQNTNLIK